MAMDFHEYQKRANAFRNDDLSPEMVLSNVGLGLAGEAGEVADLIKKHLMQGHDLDKQKLLLELGDIMWYVALGCHVIGVDMSTVASRNIAKLDARFKGGKFSVEASVNRDKEPKPLYEVFNDVQG